MAGLTLGGGLGFNDRKWGLTCDRLAETRVVLADGTVVRAAGDENADLFWACRGGAGGNFGINTAFVFDAVPVNQLRATVFSLSFSLSASLGVVNELQHLLDTDRSDDLDVRIGFKHAGTGGTTLWVLGQRLGSAFAKPGHVLYGSDWPFAPEPAVAYFTAPIQDSEDIGHHNARTLFPRLTRSSRPL